MKPRSQDFSHQMVRASLIATVVLVVLTVGPRGIRSGRTESTDEAIPHLRRQGTATQLVVDGEPFLIRGGELGNSTASDRDTLKAVWPKVTALHLNTVLAPVYWELIEPAEGRFDFKMVGQTIAEARRHGLHMVLLWFGSWKNSMSSYVPPWVKTNQQRFARAEITGRSLEALSAFSDANRDADARAFAAIGYSPFAIESTEAPSETPLARSYDIVARLAPVIARNQGRGTMAGVLLDKETPKVQLRLGGYILNVAHDYTWEWSGAPRDAPQWPRVGGLVIATAPDEFLVAGSGVIITFAAAGRGDPGDPGSSANAANPGNSTVGILSIDEGTFAGGRFVPGRRLNGDESHQGRHLRIAHNTFGIQRIKLYRYR